MGELLKHFEDNRALRLLGITPKEIVELLTPQDITKIVVELGGDRYEERSGHIIFPTICHNAYGSDMSMKLYYYFDSRLFKCYTGDEAMDIFGLIKAVRQINNEDYSFPDTVAYVLGFLDLENYEPTQSEKYISVLQRFREPLRAPTLPAIDPRILNRFTEHYTVEWQTEGIAPATQKKFGIRYYVKRNAIVIPHYNLVGKLVGIRVRNLDYGKPGHTNKYMPLSMEGKLYAHPLSTNLYGIWENREGIMASRRVIVFESEKSVILHKQYFGDQSNAVAVCGNNFNIMQLRLLIENFPLEEITFAFDKEYDDWNSQEAYDYYRKLQKMGRRFQNYTKISYIFDDVGLLEKKDSPIDKGEKTFREILQSKYYLQGE